MEALQPHVIVSLGGKVGGLLSPEGAQSVSAAIARGPTVTQRTLKPAAHLQAYHTGSTRFIGSESEVSIVAALVDGTFGTYFQVGFGRLAALEEENDALEMLADLIDA